MIFTSFIWESVADLRKLDNDIALGYLTEKITPEVLDKLEKYHIQQICPRLEHVTEEDFKYATDRGFSVRFWGIKNINDMMRAISIGGDGMTCNFPDKLSEALGR